MELDMVDMVVATFLALVTIVIFVVLTRKM